MGERGVSSKERGVSVGKKHKECDVLGCVSENERMRGDGGL